MRRIPAWVAAIAAAVLFLYGLAAGSYRLFPFYQVAAIKNTVEQWRSPPYPVYVPATPFSVAIQETAILNRSRFPGQEGGLIMPPCE